MEQILSKRDEQAHTISREGTRKWGTLEMSQDRPCVESECSDVGDPGSPQPYVFKVLLIESYKRSTSAQERIALVVQSTKASVI